MGRNAGKGGLPSEGKDAKGQAWPAHRSLGEGGSVTGILKKARVDKRKLTVAIHVMVKIILIADGAMCYRMEDRL